MAVWALRALNELVPQALALLPAEQRPQVLHQSGAALTNCARYQAAGAGRLTALLTTPLARFAQTDVIVCRAERQRTAHRDCRRGRCCGCLCLPAAVDDHQSANALLLDAGAAGWCAKPSPDACRAGTNATKYGAPALWRGLETMEKTQATALIVAACESGR